MTLHGSSDNSVTGVCVVDLYGISVEFGTSSDILICYGCLNNYTEVS